MKSFGRRHRRPVPSSTRDGGEQSMILSVSVFSNSYELINL